MQINRRQFIGCAGAFPLVGTAVAADCKPVLKIGVMTDTHVGETKVSCRRVKLACKLFRQHGVDMVVNVGDVADYHYPKGYAAYRAVVEEAFAGMPLAARPKELFVYAAHDTFAYKGLKNWRERSNHIDEAFADMQRLIGAENGPFAEGTIKGFPYVVFPQSMTGGLDLDRVEKMIARAVAENPGKPVFVFAHVPPTGTTRTGRGDPRKTALFSKFPQIVNISGHTHGSLADERAIWQGAFTSVNAGCLQNWGDGRDGIVGNSVRRKNNYGALIVEVFASRIVFRRFDVRSGEEYHAENPWIVPWPFDPATAPYRPAGRRAMASVPAFAADAAPKIARSGRPADGMTLTIPVTSGEPRPYVYRVYLERRGADGTWTPHARRDFFGDFWQSAGERPKDYALDFADVYFKAGETYRFRVAPVNCWGREGLPIAIEFVAPELPKAGTTVWQSDDPMKDCKFISGGKNMPREDEFYSMGRADAYLMFPDGVWAGPKGTKFRFVADIHTVQGELPTWTIVLRNRHPLKNAHGRISTPEGDSGMLRYVVDFEKPAADHSYSLLVREGGEGKIRFGRVSIERMQ